MHEKLVSMIERVYSYNVVRFALGNMVTRWCKSDSGVWQGCPLFPLLFNLSEGCQEGFKYTAMNSEGELSRRNLAGLMYAVDVCCGKCRVFTTDL